MAAESVGIVVTADAGPGVLHQLTGVIARRHGDITSVEIIDNRPAGEPDLLRDRRARRGAEAPGGAARRCPWCGTSRLVETFQKIYGKRIIIMGGGAQVGQVAIGAISEADRHNIRGEHISVDTIPLVGEQPLADAVRAVARLPRVRALVLAGSLMGGDIEAGGARGPRAGPARDQPQHGRAASPMPPTWS